MKFFTNVYKNINDIKQHFKQLAKQYHSDLGGSDELFREMYSEYQMLLNKFVNKSFTDIDNEEISNELRDVLKNVVSLEDIEIEVIGKWIWIGGDTFPHRDILKDNKFFYSSKHKKWYYNGQTKKLRKYSKYKLEDIKGMYSVKEIETKKVFRLG